VYEVEFLFVSCGSDGLCSIVLSCF